MPRTEEFPIKFQFSLSQEQEERIADWRRRQRGLPNRNQAIRDLIDIALEAEAEQASPAPSKAAGRR